MSWLQCLLEFDQNNRDATSIPGYVTKKNSSRRAKHGPSERQKMYYQAKQMLKKARQQKHRRHPTMVRQSNVQRLVVCHRVERKTHNVVRQNRIGEAHLRRHRSWKNSKFEALDSHAKCRRTSANTESTTLLCSSEKRMQTIARRAPGKDPRRIYNHASQSISKTARRTTLQGQRRIRLRGWR